MFITDGTNIKLPQGDSAQIAFRFVSPDGGTPYILSGGQSVKLEVRPVKGAEPIITKTVSAQSQDGSVIFDFTPQETSAALGVYNYSVRIVGREGALSDTWLGFPQEALMAIGMDCPAALDMQAEGSITVKVEHPAGGYPEYAGDYTVSPSFEQAAVLETAGKLMTDDVTVEPVPVTETENGYGGITLTIGGQNA